MSDYRTAWLSARKRAAEQKKRADDLEARIENALSEGMAAASRMGWARTKDRTARTENARTAFQEKFLEQAGWNYAEAERLKTEHYREMAAKSHETRRRNRAARESGGAT